VIVTMHELTCGCCHINFSIPETLFQQCQRHRHKAFWCPAGHELYFIESDYKKMEREKDRLVQQLAEKDDEILLAQKEAKRLQKRAHAGVCPCCNRTFVHMARHMKTKHPLYGAGSLKQLTVAK
jgi:uncharacterized protein with PIN domain